MLAFAIASLALAQASGTVSVSTLGESVTKLLAEISKQTGLDLRAAPELKDDILECLADNVSVKDLLPRLAEADWAQWRRDGSVRWLERPSSAVREQERREDDILRDRIQRAIDMQTPSFSGSNPQQSPAIATAQIADIAVKELGASAIVSVPVGSRAVYAFDPTPDQRSLPPGCETDFAPYLETIAESNHLLPSQLGVLIWVQRGSETTAVVQADIYINGRVSHAAARGIGTYSVRTKNRPEKPGDSSTPLRDDDAPHFEIPTRDQLLHPETYEPHSFGQARIVQAIARQEGVALVAGFPDESFDYDPAHHQSKVTSRQLRNQLMWDCDLDDSSAGWLVVRPTLPLMARSQFVARGRLGNMLRLSESQGGLTLDQMALFVATGPVEPYVSLALGWTHLASPVTWGILLQNQRTAAQFYLDLTSSQKNTLQTGGSISGNDLPSDAGQDLRNWLLFQTAMGGEHDLEPSVFLENGLPASTTIAGQPWHGDAIQVMGANPLDEQRPFESAYEIGFRLVHPLNGGLAAPQKFRVARSENLNLQISVGRAAFTLSLMAGKATGSTDWVDMSELPLAVRRSIIDAETQPVYLPRATGPIHP